MYALIPAAGSGSRLGAGVPKQYLPVAGEPMLAHPLRALLGCEDLRRIVVVTQAGDESAREVLGSEARAVLAPCGGPSRAASVRAGLGWLLEHGASPGDWVLVHDAARCCITTQAVRRLIDACVHDEVGGLLALPLADTLKRQREGTGPARVQATVPRSGLWQAQTPQMFRIGMLAAALDASADREITDEASAIEGQGLRPLLVPGEASNFKVTLTGDLELADAVLRARRAACGGD